jgi:hypothetical protein
MSGYIIEPHLQAAVQAQSMLKDGLIDLETALGSLRVISRDGLTILIRLCLKWAGLSQSTK